MLSVCAAVSALSMLSVCATASVRACLHNMYLKKMGALMRVSASEHAVSVGSIGYIGSSGARRGD